MELSIIICTYNRSTSLRRTIDSIMEMSHLDDLNWELIVIDNDSDDNTREVVDYQRKFYGFPIRYLLEKKRGLSFARNRGIMEARGKLLAFTDDDVIVDKYWGWNIIAAFQKYDATCIGGKILPIWEKPKPKWLSQNLYSKLALLDYGDKEIYLEKPIIWGANCIIESGACRHYGGFNTRLGRIPGKLYAGEETDLLRRLLHAKEIVMYVPDIVVYHRIPEQRMKKTYFRRWFYDQGELAGILLADSPDSHILGVPFCLIRELMANILVLTRALKKSGENRFTDQLRLIGTLGILIGTIRRRFDRL